VADDVVTGTSCPLRVLAERGVTALADGDVLVAMVADRVVAYRNRCLHKGFPLDRGHVRDGVLTCPEHFWRYRLADGALVNGVGALPPVPVTVVDGEVHVAPPPPQTGSLRDLLLTHARTWSRDG
jgi:nitrite reductase/ring-hydroxylating ferredoxin subunit